LPAVFTLQIINEDVERCPQYGKVVVHLKAFQGEKRVKDCSLHISGWPQKEFSWKVTFPNLEIPISSCLYNVQLDDGDRLSSSGGIVAELTWSSPKLENFTIRFKKSDEGDVFFPVLEQGISEWLPEKTFEERIQELKKVFYIDAFLPN